MKFLRVKEKIYNISDSVDKKTALKNENSFYSTLFFMIVFTGSIVNFLVDFFYLGEPFNRVFTNSLILLICAFSSVVISYFKNEKLKMYLYALNVSFLFTFSYYEFYRTLGPSINLLGLLFLITLLIYSRIDGLIIYYIVFLATLLTSKVDFSTFSNWKGYNMSKIVILTMILVEIVFIYKVYKNRQNKIEQQYNEILVAKDKLYATLVAVGDGVISINMEGLIDYMNPVAEDLTGWCEKDAKNIHYNKIFQVFDEETEEVIELPIKNILTRLSPVERMDHVFIVDKNNTKRFIEYTMSPIKGNDNQIFGGLLVIKDVTQERMRRQKIEYLSFHDHLTGLYNRHYYENTLKKIDKKENLPLSCIFADVNGLKTINDTFGHEAGDDLIKSVATIIKEACGNKGLVFRIGGDEFVILCPKTDHKSTQFLIGEIEQKLQGKEIRNVAISVSFGMDIKNDLSKHIFEVLKYAEDAMYNNKIRSAKKKKNAVIWSIYHSLIKNSQREKAHSKHVGKISVAIGRILGLEQKALDALKIAAELHDIGKIAVDESILNKKESLTELDWQALNQHSEVGYRLLSTSSEFYEVAKFVRHHHEQWDGLGYPSGLKGEKIPLESRIISIADAYDKIMSKIHDSGTQSFNIAIAELQDKSGSYFDPNLVDIFVNQYLNGLKGDKDD